MKYMLDTNICIYLIKNKPATVKAKFQEHSITDICISSITLSELLYGAEKSKWQAKSRLAVIKLLSPVKVLDFDANAAFAYGKLRADLEQKGTPIGPLDMLIAGHALAEDLVLVTNNTKEFARVVDLKLENWVS